MGGGRVLKGIGKLRSRPSRYLSSGGVEGLEDDGCRWGRSRPPECVGEVGRVGRAYLGVGAKLVDAVKDRVWERRQIGLVYGYLERVD
ncbi:hypothetical protein Ct61P_15149 [Colletotrichum tofieldiae]|nr:hypothetical protein Ct61P_15149 [Colletotrichum tofieldiae]